MATIMTFQEFQNRARLYVIGALYPTELAEFERAKLEFGGRAKSFLRECYALREAFALSLRPAGDREGLKQPGAHQIGIGSIISNWRGKVFLARSGNHLLPRLRIRNAGGLAGPLPNCLNHDNKALISQFFVSPWLLP